MQGQIAALSIVAHGAARRHLSFRRSGRVLLQVGKVSDPMVALGVLFRIIEDAL